jgi:hypothetical protein
VVRQDGQDQLHGRGHLRERRVMDDWRQSAIIIQEQGANVVNDAAPEKRIEMIPQKQRR